MYFTILCFLWFMDLSILVVVLGLLGIQRWLLETVLQAQVVASGIGANVRDPWMGSDLVDEVSIPFRTTKAFT